jgi:hypothetical protein
VLLSAGASARRRCVLRRPFLARGAAAPAGVLQIFSVLEKKNTRHDGRPSAHRGGWWGLRGSWRAPTAPEWRLIGRSPAPHQPPVAAVHHGRDCTGLRLALNQAPAIVAGADGRRRSGLELAAGRVRGLHLAGGQPARCAALERHLCRVASVNGGGACAPNGGSRQRR